jgi:hypothetical protein
MEIANIRAHEVIEIRWNNTDLLWSIIMKFKADFVPILSWYKVKKKKKKYVNIHAPLPIT